MRSPDDVFQDLERDRQQREAEIRLIENLTSRCSIEAERCMLRRSLVLLTYAHLEGFCKFALFAYAGAVNAMRLSCREAASALVASSLSKVFAALRDTNSKHPYFASGLPDDRGLHLSAREQLFIENFEAIATTRVEIPDHVVDTKSNLNAIILKRNLFQLGLNYPAVDTHGGSLNRLLGVRNAIAHGDALKVPKDAELQEYIAAAFGVMGFVQSEVFEALKGETYKRRPGPQAA